MKRLICILAMLLLCSTAIAQDQKPLLKERKFSFAINYRAGISVGSYDKIIETGEYRINNDGKFYNYVTLDFNYAISPKWEVGLAIGVYDTKLDVWRIPLYANAQYFFNDRTRGWFNYVDVGANIRVGGCPGSLAGFGGGYRLYIADKFKMDFTLGYMHNYSPQIPTYQSAIQLGVALVF